MGKQEEQKQLLVHQDCPSVANFWTKISAICGGIFGIFRGISRFLFIYSMIYLGNSGYGSIGPQLENPALSLRFCHLYIFFHLLHLNLYTIFTIMSSHTLHIASVSGTLYGRSCLILLSFYYNDSLVA
jgi:hypothetical protein